jgi:hypothetical protein
MPTGNSINEPQHEENAKSGEEQCHAPAGGNLLTIKRLPDDDHKPHPAIREQQRENDLRQRRAVWLPEKRRNRCAEQDCERPEPPYLSLYYGHSLTQLTAELSDAGAPAPPLWQLTQPARIRSSDFVGHSSHRGVNECAA